MSCSLSICEGLLGLLHCAGVQWRKRLSLITRFKGPLPPASADGRTACWQAGMISKKRERERNRERENKYEGRIEGREGGRAVGQRGCKLLRQLLERWARTVWHIDHAGVSTSCLKIRLNERSEDMRERDGGEGRAGELKQFAIKITSGREEEEEEAKKLLPSFSSIKKTAPELARMRLPYK